MHIFFVTIGSNWQLDQFIIMLSSFHRQILPNKRVKMLYQFVLNVCKLVGQFFWKIQSAHTRHVLWIGPNKNRFSNDNDVEFNERLYYLHKIVTYKYGSKRDSIDTNPSNFHFFFFSFRQSTKRNNSYVHSSVNSEQGSCNVHIKKYNTLTSKQNFLRINKNLSRRKAMKIYVYGIKSKGILSKQTFSSDGKIKTINERKQHKNGFIHQNVYIITRTAKTRTYYIACVQCTHFNRDRVFFICFKHA